MEPRHDLRNSRPSRRSFLAGAGVAAAGALTWIPVFRATPASAQATSAPPPGFPASIALYQQAYQNWAGMIAIDSVWTCAPASASDVVTLANWAHANGYRLRAKGMSHKAWACTSSGPWTSSPVLASTIPAAVSAGQASGDGWTAAVSILAGYDPGAVFSNPFLDTLLG